MSMKSELKEFVARRLFEIDAVRFSESGWRLAVHEQHPRAPLSPFYIDLRLLRSYPRFLCDVVSLMVSTTPQLWDELELISDVPVSSTPIVTLVSQRTGIAMVSPRLAVKTHGASGEILGAWRPGQSVAIVDDLRTTGGTKERVMELYETNGLKVVAVAALIDRGSPEGAPVAGRPFLATYGWSWLLRFYQRAKLVPSDAIEHAERYPDFLTQHLAGCQGCA